MRTGVTVAGLLLMVAARAQAAPTLAPANVKVSGVTQTHMTVSWDAPTEAGVTAASARAYQSPVAPNSYSSKTSNQTLTSADIDSLACGTSYRVVTNFYDGQGRSPDGTITATTAPCTKPAPLPPSNVSASPQSAGAINFSWDAGADPSIVHMAHKLTGPLAGVSNPALEAPDHSVGVDRLVCGESYVLSVWWVNDEGRPSDVASVTANTLDCSTLGPPQPGPSMVKITRAELRSYTVEFDPMRSDVIGYRISAAGPGVSASRYSNTFFVNSDTFAGIDFTASCGETYTISVQWVFSDGGISQPSTASAPAPACPVAPPPLPDPTPVARDTVPPVVTVAKTRLRVNRRGAVAVGLACMAGEDHCTGTLTLRAGGNGRGVRLPGVCGHASFRIAGGRARTITIVLRRSALAALRKAGSARFVLAIAAQDDSANKAKKSVTLRLTAPPGRT